MTTDASSNGILRLNKHLALQLGISRREADLLIEKGSVTINGNVATLGARFNANDLITVSGTPLQDTADVVYLAFNKPVGYVCSRRAQGDNPTIYDLLPPHYHALKPVGRLDKNSSGLILLTNDGDFAYRMTHPKFIKAKVYNVRLDHDLAPLHQQMISDYGVQLEDGTSQFVLERLANDSRRGWQITMHEGRNRQIRRTFSALGYEVKKLHRTNFGEYALGDIPLVLANQSDPWYNYQSLWLQNYQPLQLSGKRTSARVRFLIVWYVPSRRLLPAKPALRVIMSSAVLNINIIHFGWLTPQD